jgi:hypothetical protein
LKNTVAYIQQRWRCSCKFKSRRIGSRLSTMFRLEYRRFFNVWQCLQPFLVFLVVGQGLLKMVLCISCSEVTLKKVQTLVISAAKERSGPIFCSNECPMLRFNSNNEASLLTLNSNFFVKEFLQTHPPITMHGFFKINVWTRSLSKRCLKILEQMWFEQNVSAQTSYFVDGPDRRHEHETNLHSDPNFFGFSQITRRPF